MERSMFTAREITVKIDESKCTGCGSCTRACTTRTLSVVDKISTITGHKCIGCGQCIAVCPEQAVSVGFIDRETFNFETITPDGAYHAPGCIDPSRMAELLMSRRSCRLYSKKQVSRETLRDLVRLGITAPSGSNFQHWTFTLLPTPEAVRKLSLETIDYFRRLNKLADKSLAVFAAKLFLKDALGAYRREYYQGMALKLDEWDSGTRDPYCYDAPAAIIVGSKPGSTSPLEDAMLATENIVIGAHAMGLSTCLIGLANEAIRRTKKTRAMLGIPEEEQVHAVIAVGYCREKYLNLTGRKNPEVRYFEG
jgi:nitroreductase/NAD-dependent dihydropyrimidine dehydrogenase PreA subunit